MNTLFVKEATEFREATSQQILASAEAALQRRLRKGSPVFSQPETVRAHLRMHLGDLPYEVFGCLYLDSRRRLIAREDLFRGTIDQASVYSREVIRACIANNASNLIFYHNHPSGSTEPSQADEYLTQRLKQAAALIDVHVLDHWIIGESVFSFAENGLI